MNTVFNNSVEVILTDLHGNQINEYASITACSKANSIDKTALHSCLAGKCMAVSKKYMVFYKEFFNPDNVISYFQKKLKRKALRGDVSSSKKRKIRVN